ncbi:leucyl/phenylalanyl-tRNA--protein transferase [Brevundimonas sp. 2R-24]|uniref:Leucyl/phenylalanyl-tRNA--protein transferase n=1 Tax=Peiella sedimenti TaxID=3061083 RepID=A0ABT8SJT6_9CAUL|nr:leucyl/phenylalanyl-tRNA--protein transferase [Caulobacteraceae bacterium XZ-24]
MPYTPDLTPHDLLQAYAMGVFPMADSRDDPEVYFVRPRLRALLPLEGLKVSRRLARTVRQDRFAVTVDEDFAGVLDACAAARPGREDTWINGPIRALYLELHRLGFAHSIECREADGRLVGGLYGVALGGAFFGESMFSDARDASKAALIHLAARLKAGRFALLDAQFMTPHLASLGAIEIDQADYLARLERALRIEADFWTYPRGADGRASLHEITQAS